MKWAPEFIDQLASIAANRLEAHYENNWEQYYEVYDGHLVVDVQPEETFYTIMVEIADDHEIEDYDGLAEAVWPSLDQSIFDNAKDEIMDRVEDRAEYFRDPLRYHGFSQRDFL
jgi:hypothetical protein